MSECSVVDVVDLWPQISINDEGFERRYQPQVLRFPAKGVPSMNLLYLSIFPLPYKSDSLDIVETSMKVIIDRLE